MLIEVGKTYVNQAGNMCKVVCRIDRSEHVGVTPYFSYFPLEDGKENREHSYHVDKYGSYLGGLDSHDLVVEYKMPDLKWEWSLVNKDGLWAYGGDREQIPPVFCSIDMISDYTSRSRGKVWRCYLGPLPQIAQPKKLVKQTLWMVKCFNRLLWEELWLPDEETPKLWCLHDIAHKTCTTRTV
jgi:hypothetical protein